MLWEHQHWATKNQEDMQNRYSYVQHFTNSTQWLQHSHQLNWPVFASWGWRKGSGEKEKIGFSTAKIITKAWHHGAQITQTLVTVPVWSMEGTVMSCYFFQCKILEPLFFYHGGLTWLLYLSSAGTTCKVAWLDLLCSKNRVIKYLKECYLKYLKYYLKYLKHCYLKNIHVNSVHLWNSPDLLIQKV